jgi:predicted Zn-dependent peptidase
MNRLGKNELMLGRHLTIDDIIGRIEAVTQEEIRQVTKELFSRPFALAMVGQSDKAIQGFRRDQLAAFGSN